MDHPHVSTAGLTLFMTYVMIGKPFPILAALIIILGNFSLYVAGFFMSSRLFPLVLRTKELLHWSVLPWPRRDTLRVCAYFPIGVLLIL